MERETETEITELQMDTKRETYIQPTPPQGACCTRARPRAPCVRRTRRSNTGLV